MESWRHCWRVGVAPLLSTESLEALRVALDTDDQRLCQKMTTFPPPLLPDAHKVPEQACALGYCGWQGDGLETVGEVEEFFAAMCAKIDERMGERAACRFFLNAYDDWKRQEMRENLLPEVLRSLQRRAEGLPDDGQEEVTRSA